MSRTFQLISILSLVLYSAPSVAVTTCEQFNKLPRTDQEKFVSGFMDGVSATLGILESTSRISAEHSKTDAEAHAILSLKDNTIGFLSEGRTTSVQHVTDSALNNCSNKPSAIAANALIDVYIRASEKTDTNDKSSNSLDGFSALLIVTPDKDWKSKWDTDEDTAPHFTQVHSVKRGDSLTILIFFANPKVGRQNFVNIQCDIKAIRPDGSISINESNLVALKGELKGNPKSIRLAKPVLQFVAEPKDPLGEWTIEVSVKDVVRSITVPVKTSFNLIE